MFGRCDISKVNIFLHEHERELITFGEMFVKKLTDVELIDALALRDLEKLARIFKLLLIDRDGKNDEHTDSPALVRLLSLFENETPKGGDNDGTR